VRRMLEKGSDTEWADWKNWLRNFAQTGWSIKIWEKGQK
jgi:hypothetical protein